MRVAFDICCCTWKLPRDRISTCIIVRGCDSAAEFADTVAPLHTPQDKELPALSVWGGLQGAEAVCTLMGVSLGMAEELCASLQALRASPKSHTSVPEVRIIWLVHLSAGCTPDDRCSRPAVCGGIASIVTGNPSAKAPC